MQKSAIHWGAWPIAKYLAFYVTNKYCIEYTSFLQPENLDEIYILCYNLPFGKVASKMYLPLIILDFPWLSGLMSFQSQ